MPGLLTHLNKRYKGLIIAEALPVCWSISRSIPSLFVYKKARFSMWQWLYTRHSVGNLFFAVNPSCMGVMRCKYSNLGTIWRLSTTTRGESKAEKWWVLWTKPTILQSQGTLMETTNSIFLFLMPPFYVSVQPNQCWDC